MDKMARFLLGHQYAYCYCIANSNLYKLCSAIVRRIFTKNFYKIQITGFDEF